MRGALAFDTSNYTTSAAFFSPAGCFDARRLLEVRPGELGLRQQDALFQHVRAMPAIADELWSQAPDREIVAVGASVAPRETEGSYMPCFLAGKGHAQVLAGTLPAPFYPWSHQQGHLAAAAWSAGRPDLLDRPFLAWHLSGGTTELLEVQPAGKAVSAHAIGGTADISAGQLIDRTGQALGLDFPAGPALDRLAGVKTIETPYPVKVSACTFSLSGMENQMRRRVAEGEPPERVARFVLETIAHAVKAATRQALETRPGWPVLFSGGVASNALLRARLTEGVFSAPRYAADNAMGVAILTYRAWEMDYGS